MNVSGIQDMLLIVVIACLIVLMAMIIDLAAGIYKAKLRGEMRNSYALKRSLSKFIMYEGGMLIAAGIDLLIFLCKLEQVIGCDVLVGIPIITGIVAIFLLCVEYLSLREKADEKTKAEFVKAEQMATIIAQKSINKDDLVNALTQALVNARKEGKDDSAS